MNGFRPFSPFGGAAVPAGGGGGGYVLSEDFEGPGYENSWTEVVIAGTIEDDYATSPAPLSGGYSWRVDGGVAYAYHTLPEAVDNVYAYFQMHMVSGHVGNAGVLSFGNADDSKKAFFQPRSSQLYTWTTDDSFSLAGGGYVGSTYHVWFEYEAGSEMRFFISASATKPSALQTRSIGQTAQISRIYMESFHGSNEFILDKVRVSTSGPIGSNPE